MSDSDNIYIKIGSFFGIISFFIVWIYAIYSWGFLFGLLLGWLPAIIFAFISICIWPLYVICFIGILILYNNNNTNKNKNISNTSTIVESANNTYNTSAIIESNNHIWESKKCVEENDLKICDLSYNSFPVEGVDYYRDVMLEGNSASCINIQTKDIISNNISNIRASIYPSFCVSDWGYVYIDPTIYVNKYWNKIKREDYNLPYKIEKEYDTCVWTWIDGNASIPYKEVLGNIGNRGGYRPKAFCVLNDNTLDIYTYNESL